jgi:hypothetical protein
MVINKNSENKRSLYLKYVNDIIKSLENEVEDWSINILNKKIYTDESFNIILNLEKKKIHIFKRRSNGESVKLITGIEKPFKLKDDEDKLTFNGLMISDLYILDELICLYDDEDNHNLLSVYSTEWNTIKDLETEIIPKIKMFLFDALFKNRFYKEDTKKWFGGQQDILFSDSITVKNIFRAVVSFERFQKNFDKNIIEIFGEDRFVFDEQKGE